MGSDRNAYLLKDEWLATWTVIMRYHGNGAVCQHNFRLSSKAAAFLGKDRAEKDAQEFCTTFTPFAEILYCGPMIDAPAALVMEAAISIMEHRC